MKVIHRRMILPVMATILVVGCGGGGSEGGGGAQGGTPPPSGQPPTGTSKTVIVTGAISGFGSVIVNGVHYDTTGTEVRLDDRPGSLDELRVGHVVRVEAEVDDRGNARARRIDASHLLKGEVESVDSATGTLIVAGQQVRVDDDTSFDDSLPAGELTGISAGERIEVHGFAESSGRIRATRLEKGDAGDLEIEVTGLVVELDATAKRMVIGGLAIDYSAAVLDNFGSEGPAPGDLVEIRGDAMLGDGALRASRLHREDHGTEAPSGSEAEYEGLVTRFVSPADFDVAGRRVTATAATVYLDGAPGELAPDVKVEVEGHLDAAGVLVAARVTFRHQSSVRVVAPVEGVEVAAGTLRALGLTIVVTATTRREDHESGDRFFALDDVRVGDWVEVAGYPDPSGTGRVIAGRLEREDPEDAVELRGRAEALAAPRFRIMGVAIETTPDTEFEGTDATIGAETFFAAATGRVVDVEGSWDGVTLIARKAEIEHQAGAVASPPPSTPPPATGNRVPVAIAGAAQTVAVGNTVTLDARASSDADGDVLNFSWSVTRPPGSSATLASADTSTPSFTPDVAGNYVATVTVSDGLSSSAASVTITAQVTQPPLDGAALFASNCAGCHGPITAITRMPVSNRTVAGIRSAITSNKGGMGSLNSLSDAELQAIVDAMRAANP